MKKLIIFIALFFISTFCHAQNWEKVSSMNFIKKVNGEWVDEKSINTTNVYVMLKGSEVIVKSNQINRYMTYGDVQSSNYSTHSANLWKCLDKDGDECFFIMKKFTNGTIIYMVVYNYFGIEFYIN